MSYPNGSILILSDLADTDQGDAAVISGVDGSTLDQLGTFPNASLGDQVRSGIFAVTAETGTPGNATINAINLYDQTLTQVAHITSITVSPAMSRLSPIQSNGTTQFYIGAVPTTGAANVVVHRVNASGVVDGTTWTLPNPGASTLAALAPNLDDTILYWGAHLGIANLGVIHRWDLVNNVALSDLVAMGTDIDFTSKMFVTYAGDLLVLVSNSDDYQVRRYAANGSLLMTYDLGEAGAFDTPEMWRDLDDQRFWVRGFYDATGHTSTFKKLDLSTGTVLTTFTVTDLEGGGDVPTTCPVIMLGSSIVTPQPPWPQGPPFTEAIGPDGGGLQHVPIRRLRRSPHVFESNKRIFLSRLEPYLRTGIGTTSGQGIDAEVMLRVSKDGGYTWGAERVLSAGALGRYAMRLQAYQFGVARDWVFEITVSDPSNPWVLLDLFADVEEGLS